MEKLLQLRASPSQIFLIAALAIFVYVSIWWVFAVWKKRVDVVDIAWGLGFFLIAWLSFFLSPKNGYSLILNLLVTLWAFRLAIHIYLRNRKRTEDFRYQNLKERWGKNVSLQIFLKVSLLQGGILYLVSLPIIWINIHSQNLTFNILWFSIPFWLFGFLFETISDHQLLSFQQNGANRGKLLKTGLWGCVRHPNYLGEIIQWWTIGSIALFLPFGWAFIFSPILITYLIVKVSGIAPLEKKMKSHPDFATYAKTTPSLISPPLISGSLFIITGALMVYWGAENFYWASLLIAIYSIAQIYRYAKTDKRTFLICIPISIYALFLALIQETLFIHLHFLMYPNHHLFPPFWLLFLYPLFALALNGPFSLLNRHLSLPFSFGALGALFFYYSLERVGRALIDFPFGFFVVPLSWGIYLTLLVILNRKFIVLREKYIDPQNLSKPITIVFDPKCPICFREMCTLKKRKQTGIVNYATAESDLDLKKITTQFSYREAMEKIHGIDAEGKILTGIDVLAELYARTDLPMIAILIQAPGIRPLSKLAYAIWAKFR